MRLCKSIRSFLSDTDGATTVEYCVMLASILLVMLISITAFGTGVSNWWNNIDSELGSNGF